MPKKKILIADDDREFLGMLWRALNGAYILRATTTIEGTGRLIEHFKPDLLIRGDFKEGDADAMDLERKIQMINITVLGRKTPPHIPKQTENFLTELRAKVRELLGE
ncbi:MAG TPA: hypothetical protein VF974_05565 [Patescibacteria group bacterium]